MQERTHKDDLGLGVSVRWTEECKRTRTPQLGQNKAQGYLTNVRKWRKGEVNCSHWHLLTGQEARDTT